MDKYNEYRLKYNKFYYHGFSINYEEEYIYVTYDFEIEGLIHFNPIYYITGFCGFFQ